MHRILTACAGTLLAASLAAPAHAQIKFDFGNGDFNINVWPVCLYDAPRASKATVRQYARASGYRHIHDIKYHGRRFNRRNKCGFYRAAAARNGRRFVIYANADTGRLISARRVGRVRGHRRLNEGQIRARLRHQGYRHIRNIRYVDRGRREMYVARARKGGAVFRVRVDERTGKVESRTRLKTIRASKQQVRHQLRRRGYRHIANLRVRDRGGNELWVARAVKNSITFRVFADIETGRPIRRVRLENERASRRDVRQTLHAAGYRHIRNLRFVDQGKRERYVARADRRGHSYRVIVTADSADIVRSRRVN